MIYNYKRVRFIFERGNIESVGGCGEQGKENPPMKESRERKIHF